VALGTNIRSKVADPTSRILTKRLQHPFSYTPLNFRCATTRAFVATNCRSAFATPPLGDGAHAPPKSRRGISRWPRFTSGTRPKPASFLKNHWHAVSSRLFSSQVQLAASKQGQWFNPGWIQECPPLPCADSEPMDWLRKARGDSGNPPTPPKATGGQIPAVESPGLKRLIVNLTDPSPQVRCAAAQALEQPGDPSFLSCFLNLLEDEHFEVRLVAIKYLRRINDPVVAPALIAHLDDADSDVRQAVAQALGAVRNRTALEPLILSLADEEPAVRHAAAAALEAIDPRWVRTDAARRAVLRLEALRADPRPWIVAAAERVLEKLRSSSDSSTETWKRESGIRTL